MEVAELRTLGACAIGCYGVSKSFPVLDEGVSWRVIFGIKQATKNITALQDISFAVPKGEFLGILGRNGAGKSTLLRILGGVYQPTVGSVSIEGSVSGLFELGGLGNGFLTGREYARRVMTIEGVSAERIECLLDEVWEFSELGSYFDEPIRTYSSGMGARLFFSTATAMPYDVYLIDEILSVGDQHFQAKCWSRLRERFSKGASGVLVTHDWSAVLRVCEEACILDRGHITRSGAADVIVRDYLQLPRPQFPSARFGALLPVSVVAVSKEDLVLDIPINCVEDKIVEFGFSVEVMRLGHGWEILLLGSQIEVARKSGEYGINLSIPTLPLVEGTYLLNLFLGVRDLSGERHVCDVRSWTYGNGINLTVTGDVSDGCVTLPFQWSYCR
jgi:lipopolysaccharide transport system ATP-binding protein